MAVIGWMIDEPSHEIAECGSKYPATGRNITSTTITTATGFCMINTTATTTNMTTSTCTAMKNETTMTIRC